MARVEYCPPGGGFAAYHVSETLNAVLEAQKLKAEKPHFHVWARDDNHLIVWDSEDDTDR